MRGSAISGCWVRVCTLRDGTSGTEATTGASWRSSSSSTAHGSSPRCPSDEVDHIARQVAQYSDEWKRKGHNPSWLEERHKRGRRSGTVRKKQVRNRNRRVRRDRASGMRYRDLCIKYEMSRSRLDAICNRRPQRVPIDMELDPSIAHLPPTSPTIRKMVKADHAKGASYKMLAEKYGLNRYQLFIIKHSLPLPLVNPVKTERLRGAARRILDWQSDESGLSCCRCRGTTERPARASVSTKGAWTR